MDRNQLVSIAVTAVISVTAKEFLTWLVSEAKKRSISDTAKHTVRKIFSKNNLKIIWAALNLSLTTLTLVSLMRKTAPIARRDILFISLMVLCVSYWCIQFAFVLITAIVERKRPST